MQTATLTWTATTGWSPRTLPIDAGHVLYFGHRVALADGLGVCGTAMARAPGATAGAAVTGGVERHSRTMAVTLPGGRGA
jgi:hypothetical protein